MTMFEQQILCRKLPNSFNNIKIPNNDKESHVNTSNKIIQDFKRRMLNIELEQYEVKILQYEYQFEQEFTNLPLEQVKYEEIIKEWKKFRPKKSIDSVNTSAFYLKSFLCNIYLLLLCYLIDVQKRVNFLKQQSMLR